jgi:hypothetical protein
MKLEIHFEFRGSLRKFQDLNFWDATLEHLPPGQISNWDDLVQAFAGNFQGTYMRPGNS